MYFRDIKAVLFISKSVIVAHVEIFEILRNFEWWNSVKRNEKTSAG